MRCWASSSPTSARFNKSGPVQGGPCPTCPAHNCTLVTSLLAACHVVFSPILIRPDLSVSITPWAFISPSAVSYVLARNGPAPNPTEKQVKKANIPAAASTLDKLARQARSTKTSTVGPSAVSGIGGPGHVESRRKEALGTESTLGRSRIGDRHRLQPEPRPLFCNERRRRFALRRQQAHPHPPPTPILQNNFFIRWPQPSRAPAPRPSSPFPYLPAAAVLAREGVQEHASALLQAAPHNMHRTHSLPLPLQPATMGRPNITNP